MPKSLIAEGKVDRRLVGPLSANPRICQEFLPIDDNKTDLFSFLVRSVAHQKHVITTSNTGVLSTNHQDVPGLAPCTHEEADTRILFHLNYAVWHGNCRISICTIDTDLVVLAITSVQQINISELWIVFCAWNNFKFLACHKFMSRLLGPDQCINLPTFHAFTRCDTLSCFAVNSKGTDGTPRNAYGDITPACCALVARPAP